MSQFVPDQDGFQIFQKNESTKGNILQQYCENENGKIKYPELKLWINDLLKLKCHMTPRTNCNRSNHFSLNGILFDIVDIYGVITGIHTNKYGILYKVEDGTGEIGCWFDRRLILKMNEFKNMDDSGILIHKQKCSTEVSNLFSCEHKCEDLLNNYSAVIPHRSLWLYRAIYCDEDSEREPFTLSKSVHIRGKLDDFREERCVKIYNIRSISDVNEEIDRRYELFHLYETVYRIQ